jgi:hypothetical protein
VEVEVGGGGQKGRGGGLRSRLYSEGDRAVRREAERKVERAGRKGRAEREGERETVAVVEGSSGCYAGLSGFEVVGGRLM